MYEVWALASKDPGESRLDARLRDLPLGKPRSVLQGRDHRWVDHLVVPHTAATPALDAGAADVRVVAPGEEVRNAMAALRLQGHQVLGVGDQSAGPPRREAPP